LSDLHPTTGDLVRLVTSQGLAAQSFKPVEQSVVLRELGRHPQFGWWREEERRSMKRTIVGWVTAASLLTASVAHADTFAAGSLIVPMDTNDAGSDECGGAS